MKKLLSLMALSALFLSACSSAGPSLKLSGIQELTDAFIGAYQESAEAAYALTSTQFQDSTNIQVLEDMQEDDFIQEIVSTELLSIDYAESVKEGEEGGPYSVVYASGDVFYSDEYQEKYNRAELAIQIEFSYDYDANAWLLNMFDISVPAREESDKDALPTIEEALDIDELEQFAEEDLEVEEVE